MKWNKSGANWIATTWIEEAQVIYLLEQDPRYTGEYWALRKKVCGAANCEGSVLFYTGNLDRAKAWAQEDAEQPL